MSDEYEHSKPYLLTAEYFDNPQPSVLTAPYDLHAVYDEAATSSQSLVFIVSVSAPQLSITTNSEYVPQINAKINAVVTAPILTVALNSTEPVEQTDVIFSIAVSAPVLSIGTIFDFNNQRGLSYYGCLNYQSAHPILFNYLSRWAKPFLKAHNSAFIFERGLTISNTVTVGFDKATFLQHAVKTVFEEATGLSSDLQIVWQENDKRFIARTLVFEESEKLLINRQTDWQEMIRKRRKFTFSHEVADVFEKRFTFKHDKGLELITTDSISWDVAKAVYYRKSSVDPIEPQPKPEYVGSTDLNFICLCSGPDPHNLVLNFGADDCIPGLAPVDWWYIVNDLKVTRLDNGQEIQVKSGNYRCDRNGWCWSYNLVIPSYELPKTLSINGQPVILKIMINGNEHRMLVESRPRSQSFANDTRTLVGRSPSALLDAPYSPTRSFTQENERTSVQLAQAELDRVNSDIVLNWQLIDALGWILPANSMSYSNLTPIAAIKLLADAGGGFIYSEPASNTLTIKSMYKKVYWDSVTIDDYDRLIPESIVTNLDISDTPYPDYNGIFLTNDRSGDTGQVKRIGTAGDVLQEPVNSPLFTSALVMHSKGRSILAKSGMVENHSWELPIASEIGLCTPGELIAYNGEWFGVVDSVSGSFTNSVVKQTIEVERVNRE
ncbi:hypothetical protein QLH32_04565 [Acinetobacter corruptisaponis]|uniref:Tip attachment protein J domain-containing protein n=1 Tax=Acinetobacter corruptisaponis TaxID=3045147 RepID=A0ABY8S8P4_9GAMM|nr:hypothetical protein [Acinetobacter sp. KCTC 92772]WHP06749.1 hypothetical protein QLH32_04565 [Acinetobacter sp. KCTC 92772]